MNEWVAAGGGGVALIGMAWYMLKFIMRQNEAYRKIITNHLTHNTKALVDLRNTLQSLEGWLRANR